jgi:hypothetical protein
MISPAVVALLVYRVALFTHHTLPIIRFAFALSGLTIDPDEHALHTFDLLVNLHAE